MPLVKVEPDDLVRVAAVADLLEAARKVDDPDAFPVSEAELHRDLRYGFDLNPPALYVLEPDGSDAGPVGMLRVDMPTRDNLQVLVGDLVVHPDRRRHGFGGRLLDGCLAIAAENERSTLWLFAPDDDPGSAAFLARRGFTRASADARRHQVLADVGPDLLAQLGGEAAERSAAYALERVRPPCEDILLASLVEVTAAMNDAPMGSLDHEPEIFDLDRIRDGQTAHVLRGSVVYRVLARHRETGEVGGHTYLVCNPDEPTRAHQSDTAVARAHRGHRLGLALKLELLRWLAEEQPQLRVIETWNNVENDFMISVNEAMGYRLSRVFATWQRVLG